MDPELRAKPSPKDLLRKKLEAGVVARLTKVETAHLSLAFSALDDLVDKKAFQAAMIKAGHSIFTDEVLDSFWASLDINHDNTVSKKELVLGLTVLTNGTTEAKLTKTFEIFDFDRSGALTADELRKVLRALGKVKFQNDAQLEAYVDTTVRILMEKCDSDKNGEISQEEFLNAAKVDPSVGELLSLQI